MMRGILTLTTFISVILFPWPLAVLLTIAASFFEPLVPLAAGIFADTLYYAPQAEMLPVLTLWGVAVTVAAFLVRGWLKASIIGE